MYKKTIFIVRSTTKDSQTHYKYEKEARGNGLRGASFSLGLEGSCGLSADDRLARRQVSPLGFREVSERAGTTRVDGRQRYTAH